MVEEIYGYGYEIDLVTFSQIFHYNINEPCTYQFFLKGLVFYDLYLQLHHMRCVWQIHNLSFCQITVIIHAQIRLQFLEYNEQYANTKYIYNQKKLHIQRITYEEIHNRNTKQQQKY